MTASPAAASGEACQQPDPVLTYYFTFGLDSPLKNRFVALRGTMEGTRAIMHSVFGRNWAGQYDGSKWMEISHKASHRGHPYRQLILGTDSERIIIPDGAVIAHQPRPRPAAAEPYDVSLLDVEDMQPAFDQVAQGKMLALTRGGRDIGILIPVHE